MIKKQEFREMQMKAMMDWIGAMQKLVELQQEEIKDLKKMMDTMQNAQKVTLENLVNLMQQIKSHT